MFYASKAQSRSQIPRLSKQDRIFNMEKALESSKSSLSADTDQREPNL